VSEKEQVGLGKTGFYDQDIYDGSNNKYDGYVTSIAANDEIEVLKI
jgi:splicing factor 3B subunit 1